MATETDKVNVGALATIVVVGALAMVGIGGAITALVRSEADELNAQVGANANTDGIRETRTEQLTKLQAGASWVDRASGKVHIPIARAMELVVNNLERNPESATPMPPPPPSASASASAAPVEAPAPEGSAEKGVTEAAGSAAPPGSGEPKTNPKTPANIQGPDAPTPKGEHKQAPTPVAPAPAPAPSPHAP